MTTLSWQEANKRHLMDAVAGVREALERRAMNERGVADRGLGRDPQTRPRRQELMQEAADLSAPAALDTLCAAFGLSPFERDILLLCAGMELDAGFAGCCAAAQPEARRAYPTFGLALAVLPNPHWSALTLRAPLRRWRLIEAGSGELLTTSPLRIDERILHYLAGVAEMDERLVALVEPVPASEDLVPSHRVLAEQMSRLWSDGRRSETLPVAQLCGEDQPDRRAVAAAACRAVGLNLCALPVHALPAAPSELEALIRLWEREAALSSSALLLECDGLEYSDAGRANAVLQFVDHAGSLIIVSTRERRALSRRPQITLEVRKPTADEQSALWRETLGAEAERLNGEVDALVSQFSLGTHEIRNVSRDVHVRCHPESDENTGASDDRGAQLWDACRVQTRPRLGELSQRIESGAGWDDLVLPGPQKQTLQEIAVHVRQRMKVYDVWGFGSRSSRGLGISALFAGASGTGKTLAAEVLANELHLDLYRIDLSQVVSKYIGETEKNLRRVFDAADAGGAVLLFDEADALFGKRTEVKDSHDRYANIEVSYLLQRMEAYRGLAILTTNMKNALDPAFLRRIRFIVHFAFPDAAQRAEIWRRIFPGATPLVGLDVNKLARLNVAGGNIRNIALNAAFLAADADEPVGMKHLLRAARGEYAKLEKTTSEAEIGGWV